MDFVLLAVFVLNFFIFWLFFSCFLIFVYAGMSQD